MTNAVKKAGLRIAHVMPACYEHSETFIRDIAEGLANAGFCLSIVCNRRRLVVPLPSPTGIETVECRYLDRFSRTRHLFQAISRAAGQKGDFAARHLDRILSVGPLRRALCAIKPDLVYAEYGHTAVTLLPLMLKMNIPLVVHFHGWDASYCFRSAFYTQQIQGVFAFASAVIVPAQHLKRLLVIAGACEKKIHVIPYAPRLDLISPFSWEDRKKGPPSVIFLGRLTEKKNPLALVESFARVSKRVPKARFTIIGDGPLKVQMLRRISERGIDRVVDYRGLLEQQKALPIMARHWVYAQHSVTSVDGDQEGLPVSILEACASEIPVVSTIHSGIPEMIIDGVNGYLVREHDYEAMAERIAQLLEDPMKAETMGKAGRQSGLRNYKIQDRVNAIAQLLNEAVARP